MFYIYPDVPSAYITGLCCPGFLTNVPVTQLFTNNNYTHCIKMNMCKINTYFLETLQLLCWRPSWSNSQPYLRPNCPLFSISCVRLLLQLSNCMKKLSLTSTRVGFFLSLNGKTNTFQFNLFIMGITSVCATLVHFRHRKNLPCIPLSEFFILIGQKINFLLNSYGCNTNTHFCKCT